MNLKRLQQIFHKVFALFKSVNSNPIKPEAKASATIIIGVFAILFFVGRLGGFEELELRVYDYLTQAKAYLDESPKAYPVSNLLLNENDIHQHSPYPFSDNFINLILQRIEQFQPRVIGLDIYRDTPTREGTEKLIKTINSFNNIIIINKFKSTNSLGVFVMPELDNPGKVGFSDLLVDSDGIVRRGLLYLDDGQTSRRSFALQLALSYLKSENITEEPANPESKTLKLGRAVFTPMDSNDGGYVNADARGYQFLLDFSQHSNTFVSVHSPPFFFGSAILATISAGETPALLGGSERLHTFRRFSVDELLDDSIDPSLIKDKVVIVGVAADSTHDDFLIPSRNASGYPQTISGTELHGMIAYQLISAALSGRSPLVPLSGTIESVLLLVCCTLGTLFSLMAKSLSRLFLVAVFGILLPLSIQYLGFFLGFWIPMGSASMAWLVSSILTIAFLTHHEKRQKQQAMTLFGNYLSPAIAEHIWQQRDSWLQSGKPKPQEMFTTILFSDIKGFTQVANQLEPEIFMDWLNEYFDAMSGIIIFHDGIVVRFIGDAILAAFGIPVPRQSENEIAEDAQQAVRCALAMEAKLAELNKLWSRKNLPMVATRIGIHSGTVVAGSMGNKKHMEYTIHGDDVNIAARLEPLYKELFEPTESELLEKPCRILIGDTTAELVRRHFILKEFGVCVLTNHPVSVYRVCGDA